MGKSLRLGKITFKAGSSPGMAGLVLEPSTVVVLVGPNNSGKSLALRELEEWCTGGQPSFQVLSEVDVEYPNTFEEILALLETFRTQPPENRKLAADSMWIASHHFGKDVAPYGQEVDLRVIRDQATPRSLRQLRRWVLGPYTVRLDGRTRFALAEAQPSGDLQKRAENHLWALFVDEQARERVRQMTHDAFGLHFVVDPTAMTKFRARMSPRAPADVQEEQSLDPRARKFHDEAQILTQFSDGVQAFTGLVAAVMSLPHKIMLIDEPDAFLHPTLARRLGDNLSRIAVQRDANLVAATHSADFLMGCIESTPETTIVRLTYDPRTTVATARAVDSATLTGLMRDPLLRSAGALRGLFHKAVVVTESDADRALYDEVNHRLSAVNRGIPDCLFVTAQNWQTVPRIASALRRLGIPAAMVMDLDAVCNDGAEWTTVFEAMAIETTDLSDLRSRRADCAAILESGSSRGKNGLACLHGAQRSQVDAFLSQLASYGLFLVPVGELEHWLGALQVHARKDRWIENVFDKLGSDPAAEAYVKPAQDDVWVFLDQIGNWTADPARKGMPN